MRGGAAAFACLLLLFGPAHASAQQLLVPDLQDRPVDPFHGTTGVRATVLLFTSTDCPISNRLMPEVQRVYQKFQAQGVRFWLVYPNPADTPDAIRAHVKSYGATLPVLRDPSQVLVRHTAATVTPEAAVFDQRGQMVYRGRIDDRYVTLAVHRPEATRRDLDEALAAVLAGRKVSPPTTQAVGCFIADFVR